MEAEGQLGVGVRRSEDEKVIIQERFNRQGVYCCGFETVTPVIAKSTRTDPMVSLSYDLRANMMLYGTYQEGFRGGTTVPVIVEDETSILVEESIELGPDAEPVVTRIAFELPNPGPKRVRFRITGM